MKHKKRKIVTMMLTASMLVGGIAPSVVGTTALAASREPVKTKLSKAQRQLRNVMYYGDWSIWGGQGNFYPVNIPADQLTHLNYAFVAFDENGDLKFADRDAATQAEVGTGAGWNRINSGVLMALQELRAENPNLRIGTSFGGWSKSANFSTVAANPTKRAHLIDQIVKFTDYVGFDFVDLDWEFPAEVRQGDKVDNKNDEGTPYAKPEDKQNFITLLKELRSALDKKGKEIQKDYELSVALPAPKAKIDRSIDVKGLFETVDFANIMTYDMRGAWDETAGHHTGLYPNAKEPQKGNALSISESVDYYLSQGAKSEKMIIGAAYYTRGWEKVTGGKDPKNPGLFGDAQVVTKDADQTPSRGAKNELQLTNGDGGRMSGVWSYRSLAALKKQYPGLKEYWDDEAKAPYLYDANSGAFFTYDNPRSVKEKANYVKQKGLGGLIGWMASQDAPTTNGKQRDELTKASKEGLFGNAKLPTYEIKGKDVNLSVNLEEATFPSNRKGYKVTIQNNEKMDEKGPVGDVKFQQTTVKLPKFYIKGKFTKPSGGDWDKTYSQEGAYTVVEFTGYDSKFSLKPGATVSFTLQGDDAVKEMFFTQRLKDKGPEMYKQQLLGQDTNKVKPKFSGIIDQTIAFGSTFDPMAGVSAKDQNGQDLTAAIKVSGKVDTNKAGQYKLTYSVADSQGNTATENRTITVEEQKPAWEAPKFSGLDAKTINVGASFDPLAGVKATSKQDGDITKNINVQGTVDTSKAGKYELTYTVADSKGVSTSEKRTITVVEVAVSAPEFSGIENKTITVGEAFDKLAGVKATDKIDGDLTSKIKVTGNVDTNKAGSYELTYAVTNSKGKTTEAKRTITVLAKPEVPNDDDAAKMPEQKGNVVVGYWHNWGSRKDGYKNGTAKDVKISETPKDYNVIDAAFMTVPKDGDFPTFKPFNESDKEFRAEIAKLNKEGRSVLLSLGGAEAPIKFKKGEEKKLSDEIIRLVETYGFDGVDIDLEQNAIKDSDNQTVIPAALKTVKDHYKKQGKNFLITMAPEFPYLRDNGSYVPYVKALEGYYDFINPQFYNQGGDGVSSENGQWLAQNNDAVKEEFIYQLTKAIIKGKGHVQIPADKLVIGLPSNEDAAGSGFVKDPRAIENALNRLQKDNTPVKGLMTWSINWDAGENAAGQSYDYKFIKTYGPMIHKTQKPAIFGADNKTIALGSTFDAKAGVTAKAGDGTDLTGAIKIEGTVDTNKAGVYTLIYSVKDSKGNEARVIRTIIVKEEAVEAPVLTGIDNKTITVGEAFDKLAGVKATDKIDGDLTSKIKVTGNVDTNKAGSYELTYAVTNSKGKTTEAKRTITVKEAPVVSGNEWDSNKIYVAGDTVTYNGKKYRAKWWTKGDVPDKSAVWEEILEGNSDGSVDYVAGRSYVGGTIVNYNSKKFKAKWWTTSIPGSDASWQAL